MTAFFALTTGILGGGLAGLIYSCYMILKHDDLREFFDDLADSDKD